MASQRMRILFWAYCSKWIRANDHYGREHGNRCMHAYHGIAVESSYLIHKQEAKTAKWKWLESLQTPKSAQ